MNPITGCLIFVSVAVLAMMLDSKDQKGRGIFARLNESALTKDDKFGLKVMGWSLGIAAAVHLLAS